MSAPIEKPGQTVALDESEMSMTGLAGVPVIPPLLRRVSGLYERPATIVLPRPTLPIHEQIPPVPEPAPGMSIEGQLGVGDTEIESEAESGGRFGFVSKEQLRLDVDGPYPQHMASGVMSFGIRGRVRWIANLVAMPRGGWTGLIFYKDGPARLMSYTNVAITTAGGILPASRTATVTFTGGGAAAMSRTFAYKSFYHHDVEFEFDCEAGITPVLTYDTCSHPNRPPTLPCETLTVDTVFKRAGFNVKRTGAASVVPTPVGDGSPTWTDAELNDAIQVYWSRYANKAQWSMWTFLAKQHQMGSGLGGIMFDDVGPYSRQGCAIFYDSFISNVPAGDPAPTAYVNRMRFWTAIHEMGHCFNLAHSWQKELPTPWIPLHNEPEERSFMNYPHGVHDGPTAFFSTFHYRFSNQELQFLRHAPERFVEMGNADWFDHHGFSEANVTPEPEFELVVRTNRDTPTFEFMEPVMLEAKLKNISGSAKIVDATLMEDGAGLTLVIKRDGMPAKLWVPPAKYCRKMNPKVLNDGEALYDPIFAAMSLNGWLISEPGYYTVQASVAINGVDYVSKPMRLRVTPPRNYDEAYWAQDLFTTDVGRALAFDGTVAMTAARTTMQEVADRFADRSVAKHVQIALAKPLSRPYKTLTIPGNGANVMGSIGEAKAKFQVNKAEPDKARKSFESALMKNPIESAQTLGHIEYRDYLDEVSDWLVKSGDRKAASAALTVLRDTLSKRGVLKTVLSEIDARQKKVGK